MISLVEKFILLTYAPDDTQTLARVTQQIDNYLYMAEVVCQDCGNRHLPGSYIIHIGSLAFTMEAESKTPPAIIFDSFEDFRAFMQNSETVEDDHPEPEKTRFDA